MDVDSLIRKADTLIEALPYIKAFWGKTVVIKYGGRAMIDPALKEEFARDIVLMKYVGMHPVVVHGGGPQIDAMLQRVGLEPKFSDGLRVTDQATMDVVEMVLGGTINKEIVSRINRHGGRAVGLSGRDGNLITARPLTRNEWAKRLGTKESSDSPAEYGMVGDVESVDPHILESLHAGRYTPVIAPIAADQQGRVYNINADPVAGAVAGALKAEKLVMLTDVEGIRGIDGKRGSTLSRKNVDEMVQAGVLTRGMLPKVYACLAALDGGVRKAHIIDGRISHAVLLEIFTDAGIGTEIVA